MPQSKPKGNRIEGEIQRKEEWLKFQNIRDEAGDILKTKEPRR